LGSDKWVEGLAELEAQTGGKREEFGVKRNARAKK